LKIRNDAITVGGLK